MPSLTPEEVALMLQKLDEVCQQAQELQEQIRSKMIERARNDRQATDDPNVLRRPRRR